MTSKSSLEDAAGHGDHNRRHTESQAPGRGHSEQPARYAADLPDAAVRRDAPVVGHPNRSRYALGGLAVAAGMNEEHVPGLAGLLAAPFAEASGWIEEAYNSSGERYALRVVGLAIERHRRECEPIGRRIIAVRVDPAPRGRSRSGADAVKYALGAQFCAYDLRYTHAAALAGLASLGAPGLIERVAHVPGRRRTLGGRLLPALRADFGYLDQRGRASAFNRGAAAYAERCRRFAAREAMSEDRAWRGAPVTRLQRWTILDTADALGLALPVCPTSGGAADWLEASGAIVKYRKGVK